MSTPLPPEDGFYRLLTEGSRDLVCVHQPDGRFVYVSPSVTELLGWAPSDLVGRKVTDFVHPADCAGDGAAEAGHDSVRSVRRVRHRHGHFVWLETLSRRMPDGHGGVALIHATSRDISDRLRTDERLKLFESAVVNSNDSIMITDAGSEEDPRPRIVFVNQAFTQLTGYTPDEVHGRSPALLQGPQSDQGEIERIRAAMRDGEDCTVQLVNYRKDGTPFHLEARIMPIRDAGGRLTHWVGVQRDISERKNAEAEKARMESRLRETQKLESLGVLAGGIAHDFNNLLTVILGNASLARLSGQDGASVTNNLRMIEEAAERAADLCRQMLAYSGRGRFMVRALDFNQVVHSTLELFRVSVGKQCALEFDLAPNLPRIMADQSQIQQVVMNLVINASEAIGGAPGVLRIGTSSEWLESARLARTRLAPELPAGEYVIVEVQDSGCGMSPETLARAFDPFFTTKFTGRGLGLAAVLGIVRGHRGAIEVESTPGRGTLFRLFFPAVAADQAPRPPAAAAFVPPPQRTVLVVDDEALVLATARGVLEKRGLHVLIASDGVEALKVFKENAARIDAVVLDLAMPNLDGHATFGELRRIDPSVRVLLMSGYSEQEAVEQFAGAGLGGFLQKPFSAESLAAKVEAVLARRP